VVKTAYFDAFSGASGDMVLGALLDAAGEGSGVLEKVLAQLEALRLQGFRVEVRREERGHVLGTRAMVHAEGHHHARTFRDIRLMIEGADLDERVRDLSLAAFTRLASAEAKVHGVEVEAVHFHEVGAVDSIVDVVGSVACYRALGIERAFASVVPLGGGTVSSMHGTLPVPAPATLELLRDVPVTPGPVERELTTPTGAALLRTFCGEAFGPMPQMKVGAIGYGVGSADIPGRPNLLRVVIGETAAAEDASTEDVTVIETNIDDMTPQAYEHLTTKLFAAGAVDVWLLPAQMKKMRPGTLLGALCPTGAEERLVRVLFAESTTLGVRLDRVTRVVCRREVVEVETPLGPVQVKLATDPWGGLRAHPEYESVRLLAEGAKVSLLSAQTAASEACARLVRERLREEAPK